jgi:GTP-binding protein HflX
MLLEGELLLSAGAKVVLVTIVTPTFEGHDSEFNSMASLRELKDLVRTLGLDCVGEVVQKKSELDSGTILGRGKIFEAAELARELDAEFLIFDFELSASQVRNIKEISELNVTDRCHIILEIFARHARTREAKIQIDISRLKYLLPRLSGFWAHFGRQRGGVGVLGGEGEQQIELDRRMIRKRIQFLQEQLHDVQVSRMEQRKKRHQKAVTAALVGYTNAGKSSLMNRLCKVNVLEENKLFATLDSTYRTLNPDTKPPMILIDTVGFLSNLPNTLIDGFKTTLESAIEADLLIIVCDISDPNYEKHLKVTHDVLLELNVDTKEQIIVFNKADLLNDEMRAKIIKRKYPNSFVVSSFNVEDIAKLRTHIINYFLSLQQTHDLFVPYEDGLAHSEIMSQTNIEVTEHHEKGIYYRIRTPEFIFSRLEAKKYLLAPEEINLKNP